MEAATAPSRPPNGMTSLVDIVTAPQTGFASLAGSPTWGWAFLVAMAFTLAGGFLMTDAFAHAFSVYLPGEFAKDPRLASRSPEEIKHFVDQQTAFIKWMWLFNPIGLLFVNALWTGLLLIGCALAKAQGTFKALWAMSMNATAVTFGLGQLVAGLIVMLRGPADFNAPLDLVTALPSLAWIIHGNVKVTTFFAYFTPFSLWFLILCTIGLMVIARMPKIAAYATVWISFVGLAALLALFAR